MNWSGPESSAAPAPTIEATSSLGGGGMSTLTIIALIVGLLGLVAGGFALVSSTGGKQQVAGMRCRGRIVVALAAVAVGIVLPSSASAHAYLVKTVPAVSGVLDVPPPNVQLTYDEAVEPRFAIISVTERGRVSRRRPRRCTARRRTRTRSSSPCVLRLPEGWYLIYWRAISVDGHPVQGAFTYAVGPNPGTGAAVPGPEHRRVGDVAESADRAVGDVPVGDERDRPVRVPSADRTTRRQARAGNEPADGFAGVRDRVGGRVARDPGLSGFRDRDRLVCARCSTSGRWCRCSA